MYFSFNLFYCFFQLIIQSSLRLNLFRFSKIHQKIFSFCEKFWYIFIWFKVKQSGSQFRIFIALKLSIYLEFVGQIIPKVKNSLLNFYNITYVFMKINLSYCGIWAKVWILLPSRKKQHWSKLCLGKWSNSIK